MLIERPPRIFRLLFPGALFRIKESGKRVYITFDDGPVPEVTPWVLDCLDTEGIKATFFMVGDNVRKYPELHREVVRRGHAVGNHTMHHVQGARMGLDAYLADVEEADRLIGSPLFRPPHGWLKPGQSRELQRRMRLVMYDLVTRDYSKRLTARQVVDNVKRYSRPGSIIVFHDSLKSKPRLTEALPEALAWLRQQGYEFGLLTDTPTASK